MKSLTTGRLTSWMAATLIAAGVACSEPTIPSKPAPSDLGTLAAAGSARGFDVLVVTLDTTRADHLSCYGYPHETTPNIDALSTTGLRFAHAVAPAPVTLPSHVTIFTGLQPPSHGVRDNGQTLDGDVVTMAERMRDAGYATAAFLSAYVLDERFGLAQGFDVYADDVVPATGELRVGPNERPGDQTTDAALAWLEQVTANEEQRFFAWVHYFDPHFVYAPPAEFKEQFEHPYDGEIAFADQQLGRVIRHLENAGRLERTLIIVTSDHGEGLGQHGEATHSLLLYDTTQMVPLVISCPALFGDRLAVEDRVVGLADIYPTVLGLMGMTQEAQLDGHDLFRVSNDPARAVYIEAMSPRLTMGWASLHGLRRLRDKLISGPDPEYYDVHHDPGELTNLYDRSGEASSLEAQLKQAMSRWSPIEEVIRDEPEMDPEVAKRLAELGYVRSSSHHATGVRKDPKQMMEQLRRCDLAMRMASDPRRQNEALDEIHWCLETDPDNSHFWSTAARIYAAMQRLEDAEDAARNSLRIRPTSTTYVLLGKLLFDRKRMKDARAAWLEAEKLDPLNGEIYLTRGMALARASALPAAIAQFEKAIEVDPVMVGAQARRGLADAKRRQQLRRRSESETKRSPEP